MQGRFGVREICNVTFKALSNMTVGTKTFVPGQPVFSIDTAQTSNMEQATTTVYAQGGQGYNRLISWEGEKTLTFTVTDALMSPMGMSVLSGAGLIDATSTKKAHVHMAMDVNFDATGKAILSIEDLCAELGLAIKYSVAGAVENTVDVCTDIPVYGSVLNSSGSITDWISKPITVTSPTATKYLATINAENPLTLTSTEAASKSVKVDFYVALSTGVQTISIEPSSFGGYFYVEADTLFRDEATGKDLAATLIFPKVKVQSGFTFTMAASGDPSTFDFVMDAFPAYTMFDRTKKVLVDMQIVTGDDVSDIAFHEDIDADSHTKEKNS